MGSDKNRQKEHIVPTNLIEFILHNRRVLTDHVELDVGLVRQRVPVLEALGHEFLERAAERAQMHAKMDRRKTVG